MSKKNTTAFPEQEFIAILEHLQKEDSLTISAPNVGAAINTRQQFYTWRKQTKDIGALTDAMQDILSLVQVTIDAEKLTFARPGGWLRAAMRDAGVEIKEHRDDKQKPEVPGSSDSVDTG